MAIETLQTKIKRSNSPLMLDLSIAPDDIPLDVMCEGVSFQDAYVQHCRKLMAALKGEISAVRFKFLHYALMGEQGITLLRTLLKIASSLGYYTMLDVPGLLSEGDAEFAANQLWNKEDGFPCDAIALSAFAGNDVLKPFLQYCEEQKKDLFAIVRTPNKSASDIQDLLAGSRTVHLAAADYVNRNAEKKVGKSGYSKVGIIASATAGDSLRQLRTKYPNLFIIIDGLEYPGANAKNCSYAFDKLGHGAIVSVGRSICCAWKNSHENAGSDVYQCAIEETQKVKKRLQRYVTIL